MSGQEKSFQWTEKEKKEQIMKFQDPSFWDNVMLKQDLQNKDRQSYKPFNYGAFPVIPYQESLGVTTRKIQLKNINLILVSFFAAKSAVNNEFIKDKKDEVFFTIICSYNSDVTPIKNLNIISRNYPNYYGQGKIGQVHDKDDVDFAAFLTADRKQFAIINTRLFDLDMGRVILIAPQKDGSTTSFQVKTPIFSTDEMIILIDNLLKEKQHFDFFQR